MKIQEKQPMCFTIMPFTVRENFSDLYVNKDHWHTVYNHLIKPVVEEAGFKSVRDDEDDSTRQISPAIFNKMEQASIIICDTSTHNPNVFLELGWIIRSKKPYVLLKDELTERPFHLSGIHTVDYSHLLRPEQLEKSKNKLLRAIRSTWDAQQDTSESELNPNQTEVDVSHVTMLTEEEPLQIDTDIIRIANDIANLREFVILLRRYQVAIQDRVEGIEESLQETT